jgi:hypothetical protein
MYGSEEKNRNLQLVLEKVAKSVVILQYNPILFYEGYTSLIYNSQGTFFIENLPSIIEKSKMLCSIIK